MTDAVTTPQGPDFSEAWDRIGRLLCEQFSATLTKSAAPQLRSTDVAKLATSLAAAQKNFAPIPKNREVTVRSNKGDYKFKYATLDGILSATVPALAEQGLALVQTIVHDDGGNPGLETTLYHSSGEWLRNITPMFVTGRMTADGRQLPPSNQELGSAQSYARRYGISALLCVAADEDDDGNIADGNHIEGSRDVPYKAKPGMVGGTDFRPAGPRKFQGNGGGPTSNWVGDAERDGIVDEARPKGTLPAKGNANGTQTASAIKRVEWVKAAIDGFKAAQTKDELQQWWKTETERLGVIESAMPAEYERLLAAYDAAIDRTAQRGK